MPGEVRGGTGPEALGVGDAREAPQRVERVLNVAVGGAQCLGRQQGVGEGEGGGASEGVGEGQLGAVLARAGGLE